MCFGVIAAELELLPANSPDHLGRTTAAEYSRGGLASQMEMRAY
jgi:hypothetical protein